MHKPLFRIAVGSVAAVGGLIAASALPAGAVTSVRAETMARTVGSPTANTPVTFTLTTTGVLAITAPTATVDLGSGVSHNVGSVIGSVGNFGAVTVTDNRALNPAGWIATVSSTDFTNAAGDVIPAGDAVYTDGTIGPSIVSGLPYSGTDIADNSPVTLSGSAQDVVTEAGFDGDNAATWDPEIAVTVPAR